jgi:hypothetical protein
LPYIIYLFLQFLCILYCFYFVFNTNYYSVFLLLDSSLAKKHYRKTLEPYPFPEVAMQFKHKPGSNKIQVYQYAGYDRVKHRPILAFLGSLYADRLVPDNKLMRSMVTLTESQRQEISDYVLQAMVARQRAQETSLLTSLLQRIREASAVFNALPSEAKSVLQERELLERVFAVVATPAQDAAPTESTADQEVSAGLLTGADGRKWTEGQLDFEGKNVPGPAPVVPEHMVLFVGKRRQRVEISQSMYEQCRAEAKILFVQELQDVRSIAKHFNLPSPLITKWREQDRWDDARRLFSYNRKHNQQ